VAYPGLDRSVFARSEAVKAREVPGLRESGPLILALWLGQPRRNMRHRSRPFAASPPSSPMSTGIAGSFSYAPNDARKLQPLLRKRPTGSLLDYIRSERTSGPLSKAKSS